MSSVTSSSPTIMSVSCCSARAASRSPVRPLSPPRQQHVASTRSVCCAVLSLSACSADAAAAATPPASAALAEPKSPRAERSYSISSCCMTCSGRGP
eukprot:scaffold14799_cov63-Phaeocystis_antarctica.AAC.3